MCLLDLDVSAVAEMAQVGATYVTSQRLGSDVDMYINNEKIGQATLCTYEGRFAVSVK